MTFMMLRRDQFLIVAVSVFVLTLSLLNSKTAAQSRAGSTGWTSTNDSESIKTIPESNLELARQQFEFQKAIENEKLGTEKLKAWLTGGSILLPLLIGLGGIYWQVRSAFDLKAKDLVSARQLKEFEVKKAFELKELEVKNTVELKRLEMKNAFELKTAEIVLNTTSPGIGLAKAKALSEVFPEHLPADFVSRFEPIAKSDPQAKKHFSYEDKLELIRLLASHADHEKEILQWWGIMFPWHKWFLEEKF
jgi:hypothetical protein